MSRDRRRDPTLSLPRQDPTVVGIAVLVVAPGTDAEQRVPLPDRVVKLGAAADNDVVIRDPHASAYHAELRPTPLGLELVDLGSRNGIMVQGVAVSSAMLAPGVTITIGTTQLRCDGEALPPGDDGGEAGTGGPTRFGKAAGRSPAMRKVFALLARIAPTDLTVSITGETGTGKDVLARAIHAASPRADQPFVVVDGGAVAPTLIESHLFGHERGAFTGATDERQGAFELASGGTLFLDEIGELALELQPKLLRVLESRMVIRLGSLEERPIDVRIIAATNRDLEREVAEGRFRQDLFFRLGAASVKLPPLRERREDLEDIVHQICAEHGGVVVAPDALAVLMSYDWPGNVRELKNVLTSAIAVSDGVLLQPKDFILFEGKNREATPSPLALAGRTLEQIEDAAIRQTMLECGGNKTKAARALGIAPSTLYAKLKKYGIEP